MNMVFLQNNNLTYIDLKKIEYLSILSEKSDFFVCQGTNGRTLIHKHVVGFDGNKFLFHDLTYDTYLGNDLLPCVGIIIPNNYISSKWYNIGKKNGIDLLNDLNMMTDYSSRFQLI